MLNPDDMSPEEAAAFGKMVASELEEDGYEILNDISDMEVEWIDLKIPKLTALALVNIAVCHSKCDDLGKFLKESTPEGSTPESMLLGHLRIMFACLHMAGCNIGQETH